MILRLKLLEMISKSALKFGRRFLETRPLLNPLIGDRCVEYAFVVRSLLSVDRSEYRKVLDIGCFASPLTTIIKELGFVVDGIDLLPPSYVYAGVKYIQGDFLSADFANSVYDIVVLCSTLEHIGLERYGAEKMEDGDIKTLEKVKRILTSNGILILTIPYGEEKTIDPLHRVYNKEGKLLKYTYANFDVMIEEFYKKDRENTWVKCDENEASEVAPSEDNYALGLFVFRNSHCCS